MVHGTGIIYKRMFTRTRAPL